MALLKVQKNQLLLTISAAGVNPVECQLEERPKMRFSRNSTTYVTHLPSGLRLEITPINNTYYSVHPGSYQYIKWAEVIDFARRWAGEIAQPDFWAGLAHYQDLFTSTAYEDLENALFTIDEQAAISNTLQEIKKYVRKTYDLSDEEMSRIENRLDEAEQASRRIGRKDWLLLFSGTIFTLIITDLVTPDVAQHIFMMALHALRDLFGGAVRPIEGGPG